MCKYLTGFASTPVKWILRFHVNIVFERISTGCEPLDQLLNGGVSTGGVTQIYGEPGSGKTNIALSTSVTVAEDGGRVLYIDTEGFPGRRLQQLLSDEYREVAERIRVSEAYDFEEQKATVRGVSDLASGIDLVVVDSITGFYRLERDMDGDGESLRDVGRQLTELLGVARRYEIPVIVTNQVYSDFEGDGVKPLGGNTIGHWTNVILRVEKVDSSKRVVVLEKHDSEETGQRSKFVITESGLETCGPEMANRWSR